MSGEGKEQTRVTAVQVAADLADARAQIETLTGRLDAVEKRLDEHEGALGPRLARRRRRVAGAGVSDAR